jgi:hypothetical protein
VTASLNVTEWVCVSVFACACVYTCVQFCMRVCSCEAHAYTSLIIDVGTDIRFVIMCTIRVLGMCMALS